MATEAASKKTTQSKKSTESKKSAQSKKSTRGGSSRSTSKRSEGGASRATAPRTQAPRRTKAIDIARGAGPQLAELTGQEIESVTGMERSEEGWTIQAQVVEVQRIPATTDLLATYELELDEDGELLGYRRLRRFTRGAPTED